MKLPYIQRAVGIFLISAALILTAALFYMIREKRVFESKLHFYTLLDRGDGITSGTPVMYKGIPAGNVTEASLNEEGKISVTFEMFPEFKKHLKGFSFVKIGSASLLGGKILDMVTSDTGDILPNWAYIPSNDDPAIKAYLSSPEYRKQHQDDQNTKIANILNNVEVITGNLKNISSDFRNPESGISSALNNVKRITSNMAQITGEIKSASPEIRQSIQDTQSTIENVNKIVKSARKGPLIRMIGKEEETESSAPLFDMDPRDSGR